MKTIPHLVVRQAAAVAVFLLYHGRARLLVQAAAATTTSSSTTTTSCASSDGDRRVGISAYADPSCGQELVEGPGCFRNGLCRYCQEFQTEQSAYLWPCPSSATSSTTATATSTTTTTTTWPTTAATAAEAPPAASPTYTPAATPTFTPATDVPTNTNTPSTTSSSTSPSTSAVLFYDDFDTFDLSQYQHENTLAGGGNWEFQLYRNNRTNSFVKNGKLHIRPTLTEEWVPDLGAVSMYGLTRESDCTSHFDYGCQRQQANPISSARINTRTFSFTTGRLEVRAKLPRGDWLWPAIWLLPKYEQYGMWPASGEIDVLEATGNAPGYAETRGVDSMLSGLHWGLNFAENKKDLTMTSYTLPSGDFSQGFNTFGLVRTETGLYTYVNDDSNRVLEVDWSDGTSFFERGGWDANHWDNPWEGRGPGAPFDQEFFLTINLAVGGTSFFPEGYGKPWNDTSTTASQDFWAAKDQWYPSWQENDPTFQIDWIKVTAL
ncbi:hypothetical protein ACA910_003343 [Epithemia clementina (nom. ined.)]